VVLFFYQFFGPVVNLPFLILRIAAIECINGCATLQQKDILFKHM